MHFRYIDHIVSIKCMQYECIVSSCMSLSTAESAHHHRQQEQLSLTEQASLQADCTRVQDRPSIVWKLRGPFRRHQHTTTAFHAVAQDNQGDVVPTTERDSDLENDRRLTGGDAEMDDDGGRAEPPIARCWPGRKLETEWTRVAEVLDRFFFYVFVVLLLIPTATILGFVRLFKP